MRSIIFTLSILALAALTTAFPNGSGTCNSNQTVIEGVPNKPMGVLTELGYSFAVTMEGNEYVPGGPPVKFCVHGKDTFKGLLLYAVDMKPERNHPGSWIIPSGAPYKILKLNCAGDPDGTVTHSDPSEKGPNVCMEWKPPAYDAGPLTFVGTIVKNKAAGFQIIRLPTIFNPKGGNNKYTTTNCDYETTKTDKYEPTKTDKYEKTTPPYKYETTPPYKEEPTTTPYKYEPTYENTATDPNQYYEPSGFNPPTFNAADGITYSGLLLLLQLIVVSTLILYHH